MTNKEFEINYNYRCDVSYKEVLDRYNSFIKEGRQEDAKRLIGEHGGVMAVLAKYNYQIGNLRYG